MELFGIEEIASSKSVIAPGWAYVPDTSNASAIAAAQQQQQPLSRKRAARNLVSARDTTSRQEAKVFRELAELDKETHRDVPIPVTRTAQSKQTPNVRKILQSHKTFANHLSDFDAFAALAPSSTTTSTPAPRAAPAPSSSTNNASKRSAKRKDAPTKAPAGGGRSALRHVSTPDDTAGKVKQESGVSTTGGAEGGEGGIVLEPFSNVPTPHPADADPLLQSRVPPLPTAEEMEALVSTPALTYGEARAELDDELLKKPVRKFCEICGYWGRVKCTRCGGRLCALECLKTHQQECFTRYGA